MHERTYLEALVNGNCPRCREGKIFSSPAYNLAQFNRMNDTCRHCGVRLEPEPGFYQGAMYVSYGFTVAFLVVISILLYYFAGDPSEWTYIGVIITVMVLLAPLNYRYSRIVYLYLFGGIKYRPAR
jgi:uncharacterized protein (DUF983 family)